MEWNIESMLFYILLIDSSVAVLLTYTGTQQWWTTHMGRWSQYFPLARGWSVGYFLLVLFIGHILNRYDILTWFW